MLSKLSKRMKGEGGFTLIELLVVIIIIAILAAIAIPTFLGQREKAQESQAKSLVRNAMTAIESAFVDDRDYTQISATELTAIEPAIDWSVAGANGSAAKTASNAKAADEQVEWVGDAMYTYELVSEAANGITFGVDVNKGSGGSTTYYTEGVAGDW